MSIAVQELTNIYKDLVEKELKDICDIVIDNGIVSYFGHKYVYVEEFIKAGREFIASKELPIDPVFIDNYIFEKMKERVLEDLATGKFTKKYINFFSKHLFDKASSYVKSEKNNRAVVINCLRSFLNFLSIRMPSIFVEFEKLKSLLDDLGVSSSNQLAIFLETIETNYSCFIQPEFYVFKPDYEKMMKYKFKYISKDQITDLVKNNKIESFLADENLDLEDAQDELRHYMEENCVDVTHFQKNCILLAETIHKEVRTEEDNTIIKECMANLFFSELTHRLFRYLDLPKEISNNHPLESDKKRKKDTGVSEEKKEIKEEIGMPKKQTSLNQILREINKYYEIETKKLKELLSIDQIIYVLSLMYSIEMEKSIIEEFLRNAMRELKKLHPFAIYNQGYDKFKYLSHENSEIKYHLDMIEYILSDMNFFICSKEEYEEMKQLITEEIDELIYITNGNYQYEEIEAKKLLKNNKQEDNYGTSN